MCDTDGHEHWCNGCGIELKFEQPDTFKEIEWTQLEDGRVVDQKSMFCLRCQKEHPKVMELDKMFKKLGYKKVTGEKGIWCSVCHTNLTKKFKDPHLNIDYDLIDIKMHEIEEDKKKLPRKYKTFLNKKFDKDGTEGMTDEEKEDWLSMRKADRTQIRHVINTIVLCKTCIREGGYADFITTLRKLGKNPNFTPILICPSAVGCEQYEKGDAMCNCRHIGIGRDEKTLVFGVLCMHLHPGVLPMPFYDGMNIVRPSIGQIPANLPNPMVQQAGDMFGQLKDVFKDLMPTEFHFVHHHVHHDGELPEEAAALELPLVPHKKTDAEMVAEKTSPIATNGLMGLQAQTAPEKPKDKPEE